MVRDCQNLFEFYCDYEFRQRFRFSKSGAHHIVTLLTEDLQYDSKRNFATPSHCRYWLRLDFMQLVLLRRGLVILLTFTKPQFLE